MINIEKNYFHVLEKAGQLFLALEWSTKEESQIFLYSGARHSCALEVCKSITYPHQLIIKDGFIQTLITAISKVQENYYHHVHLESVALFSVVSFLAWSGKHCGRTSESFENTLMYASSLRRWHRKIFQIWS